MTRCLTCALLILFVVPNLGQAQSTYGLEFSAGLLGKVERDPEGAGADKHDLATSWAIAPWMEFPIGKAAGIGPEMNFVWVKRDDAKDSEDRRLIVSPHVRLRMTFPIVKRVTFDGFISLGPSWWTRTDKADDDPVEENRLGWGLRFGFGGSYAINKAVAIFMHVGYQSSTSYGDTMEYSVDSIPVALGLRAAY